MDRKAQIEHTDEGVAIFFLLHAFNKSGLIIFWGRVGILKAVRKKVSSSYLMLIFGMHCLDFKKAKG